MTREYDIFYSMLQPFMEASLDSLAAVELRNALSESFNVELPATLAFDHPSIRAMSNYIFSLIGLVGDESELAMGGNGVLSRQNSFHSARSNVASLSVVEKLPALATEVFAMSSRLPSPASAFSLVLDYILV